MGSLFDWITDWIKEGLIEAITGQYTSIFESVNSQVADVAGQVGQTPQGWNGGVFSMIQNLSETVVIPIAGMILTFVLVYELIQMILEKNNMHDFDTFNIFKWIFKTFVATYLLTNCFTIVMAVFDVAQNVVSRSAGVINGNLDVTAALADLETQLEAMGMWELIGLWLETNIINLCMWVLSIVIFVIVYVDHSKLIKQLWSLNIRDKELLYVIRRILKAPILMPDGNTEHPTKGTPQGGIISPLLANVVLNELDHWIESQWQCNPVTENYAYRENAAGCPIQSHAYRAMRNTRLKEMYIVRYADDFRILCRTREQADRTLIAVTQWLKERLRLDVSPEKTRVVDVRRSYSEFLGFKIRLRKKGKKYVVQSHMCDKAYKKVKASLTKQVGNIKFPRKGHGEAGEVRLFNSMVMGIQNYYQLATDISIDCGDIGRTVNTVLKNRLKSGKTHRLKKEGRDLTKMEIQRYGKSEQLRYIAQSKEPIYPISYVQCKNPMSQRRKVCAYTAPGRSEIHDDLRINTFLLLQLMRAPTYSRSTEYADNRISLFSAQWGKCAVTGKKFQCISEIHCHHKKPKGIGGSDKYENLVLVLAPVHELIHAVDEDTIRSYLTALKLDTSQLTKLNKLRTLAKRKPIDLEKPNLTNNSHNGMTKETKKSV